MPPEFLGMGATNGRHHLSSDGRGDLRGLRRLCRRPEEHLMLANIIWGVGALVIGGYMVVALLRPEKF
jgi:hypothetical protein